MPGQNRTKKLRSEVSADNLNLVLVATNGSTTVLTEEQEGDEWVPLLERVTLAKEFDRQSLPVVGIQEAMARQTGQDMFGKHLIWRTQASEARQGGVELWLQSPLGGERNQVISVLQESADHGADQG